MVPGQDVAEDGRRSEQWQLLMRPLMSRMLVGTTIFFLLTSLVQLVYLQWTLQHSTLSSIEELQSETIDDPGSLLHGLDRSLAVSVILEAKALEYRHRRADVFLMARVWRRYLGFVTGMILAFIGAAFVLGRLRGVASEMDAESLGVKLQLKSASPGIILAGLGVVLILATMLNHNPIEVRDAPVYISPGALEVDAPRPANEPIIFDHSESMEEKK